jgi:hypothetical protein
MSKHSANVAAAAAASGNPNVRTRDLSDGGGHSSAGQPATTGGSTPGGTSTGAPYQSRTMNDDKGVITREGLTDNPFNTHDTDEQGVLGGSIMAKEAPMIDSPTQRSTQKPDKFGNYKATAVASVTEATPAGQPVTFPDEGVLGRG